MPLSEASSRWLVWTGVLVSVFALRIGCVLYERSRPTQTKKVQQPPIEKDQLVVLPKSYVNDPHDALNLIGKDLWVKAGFAAEYFRYPENRTPGSLRRWKFEPMERIRVRGVKERPTPSGQGDHEVLLAFGKEGADCATVIGFYKSEEHRYEMYVDDLFYLKDPRDLYSHWDAETWRKIEQHQLSEGMTFAQVDLSIGSGTLVTTEAGSQLYQFGRKPGGENGKSRVRFVDGRVKDFKVFD